MDGQSDRSDPARASISQAIAILEDYCHKSRGAQRRTGRRCIPAVRRFVPSASGRLESVGQETPRGGGPCWRWSPRVCCGRRAGGDLRCPKPVMKLGAAVSKDGHGRRSPRTQRSHHINTIAPLIDRFRALVQQFRHEPTGAMGSGTRAGASKTRAAQGQWPADRDNSCCGDLDFFRLVLTSAAAPPRFSGAA